MNSGFHQWKWDFRRLRVLWIFWLALLVALALVNHSSHLAGRAFQSLTPALTILQSMAIYLFGILLVARLMYTTPFTGGQAFWKTRPLTRTALFRSKSAAIIILFWLPALSGQLLTWWLAGANPLFLFWASLHVGALILAIYFLAAVWAAHCERPSSFMVCFASSGAWAALCAILFVQVARQSEIFPLVSDRTASGYHFQAVSASTAVIAMLILAAGTLAAWCVGGAGRSQHATRVAIGILALGITLSTTAGNFWRIGLFGKVTAPPRTELPVTVLVANEEPKPGQQMLWNQLAVDVPPAHFALVRLASGKFTAGGNVLSSFSTDAPHATSSVARNAALAAFYPDHTEILTSELNVWDRSALLNSYPNLAGTLQGELDLYLVKWQKIASLPLEVGARTRRADHGLASIVDIKHEPHRVEVELHSLLIPLAFRKFSLLEREFRYGLNNAYVLHSPKSSRALVGNTSGGGSGHGGLGLSLQSENRRIEFSRHHLFNPGTDSSDLGATRLDVYAPVVVATAHSSFRKENWMPHDSPRKDRKPGDVPPPLALAIDNLPPNPTPDQVDAYLDSIFFNFPADLRGNQWHEIESRLLAIGPDHLDQLLSRLPVGHYIDDLVFRVIRKLATEDHRGAIVQALERDANLATVALERQWQVDAAPVLAHRLRRHVPLEWRAVAPAVSIVASQGDPSTFDDLRWHFVHSPAGYRSMVDALTACPGFPFDETLAEAWNLARFDYTGRRDELALIAVRLGDKEALRAALLKVLTDPNLRDLQLLSQAVEHPGGELLPEWLHANFETLAFNKETRKFELK